MWGYTVHNTITGNRIASLKSIGRHKRAPGAGDGEHSFNLADADAPIARADLRALREPNESMLVVSWAGVPVYAGLVMNSDYLRDTATLTIQHVDVRTLMQERLTFGVSGYAQGDLTVSGKSLSGMVRGILQRGIYDWGNTWRLPVDLPADGSGSNSLRVKNWEWARIEDLLQRVEKLGAVIDFDPYYDTAGGLRFAVRVGTPHLPGASLEWVATAEATPVINLRVQKNGSRQLSGCFYMGKGTEADMRVGEAGFIAGPTIPVRDAARSAKDESDVSKLNSMALTDLQANRRAAEQWSFALVADETWPVEQLKPGARITLHCYGDPVIDDGAHSFIVTGVSVDSTTSVITPEVQPI